MAIITKDAHTWVDVTDEDTGEQLSVFVDSTNDTHNPFVPFEINFSDASKPADNTVTFYNLSKEHRDFFRKKEKVEVFFNWGKSKKMLGQGYISALNLDHSDGTTDTLQLTFTEGTDYSNVKARALKIKKTKKQNQYKTVKKKVPGHYVNHRKSVAVTETYKRGPKKGQTHVVHHWAKSREWVKEKTVNHRIKTRSTKTVLVNKTFPKGSTYKKIIEGIAAQAGIKISKIDLAKNPTMKKAYTATGKPLTLLKKLVEKTESKLMYVRGKLEIVNPKSTKRTWYTIDDNDLMQPPAYAESLTSADDNKGTWEIITPLVPDITVGTGIIMKSRYLKGKYYVKAGKHYSDGENPQTQCSIARL